MNSKVTKIAMIAFAVLVGVSTAYDISTGETMMRGGSITASDDPLWYWSFVVARFGFIYWVLHYNFERVES